ncbi:MAG: amidohydrolase family protein [Atopobiaceae bacterium]|nr:amidohydrolase family protein [Atopobiaceae bacterium]
MSAEMTRRNFVVGGALAGAAAALAACANGTPEPAPEGDAGPEGENVPEVENPADLVLKNAAVYTVDDAWTVASAVAVKGDTVMAVGSDADMDAFIGPDTEVKDLGGMMLMPGFMNGHDHIVYKPDTTCDLAATEANLDAYMAAIHEYVDAHPGQPYYEVSNLDLRAWPNSAANNERLNEEFPDTPILGVDVSVHGRIVNQALMDLAGIDENTPVPDGGVVYYYEDGTLNGYLSDAGSMLDSLPELPEPTEEECIAAFSEFQAMANSLGITGFHDGGNFESTVQMLHDFGETGNMTLRISLPIWAFEVRPQLAADTIAALDSVQELNSDFVRANSAKAKIDGVPEGRSAYMLEPYAPTAGVDADFRSAPNWRDQDELNEFVRQVNEAGYSVLIHTMGDGGAHMDTEAFEYSYDALGETWATKRNAIVHATIMDPDDIERCGKMGIYCATQAVWFYVDPQFGALELQMFGEERFGREYNMRTRLDAGMLMTSGADYPITPDLVPLHGIISGVTQGSPYPGEVGDPVYVRNADESLTVEEMMKCYTIWCARQMGFEDILGSIEVGKKADFVVLDKDLTQITPEEMAETNVVYTIFGGKIVYEG